MGGWGTFSVRILIEFVDYSILQGSYQLTFDRHNEAFLSLPK